MAPRKIISGQDVKPENAKSFFGSNEMPLSKKQEEALNQDDNTVMKHLGVKPSADTSAKKN